MSASQQINVSGHQVGVGKPIFVVAEMSGNHNGDLERALQIVDAVAAAGAQAIKIQTYTADTLTVVSDMPRFRIEDAHGLWGGRTLYDLYQEAHTPWEWHEAIFSRARELKLVPFSTPFDVTAIELLESLGTELYKTASAEIIDIPLLREIARTGKPMVVSTGAATLAEIDQAVTAVRDAGCTELILLACTASYPASPEEARLGNIDVLRTAFDVPVGLSDHTLGIGVSVAAASLGAVLIEKHFTLDREDGGVDSAFSMSPAELSNLKQAAEQARLATESGSRFGPTEGERTVLGLRRSLSVVKDVRAGDVVTAENVRSIRPAGGMAPIDFQLVQGRRFVKDVQAGTALTWDLI